MGNQDFLLGKEKYDVKNLWKDIRKKHIIFETKGLILMILIAAFGIVSEVLVRNGIVYFIIEDIDSYSSTLLQIQSAVATLTIALVALISGNILKSYMGVSICDFNLNISPVIFKQKRIIILSIVLLAMNVIFDLFSLYNLVLSLFFVAIILVMLSVCEIYEAFTGKESVKDDIKKYVIWILADKNDYTKKNNIFQDYINDWKECCLSQSQLEYEDYLKVFYLGMQSLLNFKSDESIKDVEKACSRVAYCLLSADRGKVVERGIDFIYNVYDQMVIFTFDGQVDEITYEVSFNVFGEILPSLEKAMEFLPLSTIEEISHLYILPRDIAKVCYSLHCGNESENNGWFPELQSIFQFSRYIGIYLNKQVHSGVTINNQYWGYIIKNADLSSTYGIPAKFEEEYLKFKCQLYFDYCYGLICNGFLSIVKESAFYYAIPKFLVIKNKYQALSHLLIACFLYYLAEKENESCASDELIANAKEFIEDTGVKDSFNFFIHALSEHHEFLGVEMENELCDVLSPFELFPKHSKSKSTIMDYVTEEFYVFLILYMNFECYVPNLLPSALGNDIKTISRYHNDFLGMRESITKTNFRKFYSLVNVDLEKEETIQGNINSVYEEFEQYVKWEYKKLAVEQAIQYQKEYESNSVEDDFIKTVNEKVKMHIISKFVPIIVESKFIKQQTFQTVKFESFTECLNKAPDEITSALNINSINDINFFKYLCDFLSGNNAITIKERAEFEHESDLSDFLIDQKNEILIGAESQLKYNDYFQKYICVPIKYSSDILALKKDSLKINIEKVNTTVHPLTLEEANPTFDQDNNRYMYEIRDGIIVPFTKEELESFLHDQKKIVNIDVDLSYELQDNVGTIIRG